MNSAAARRLRRPRGVMVAGAVMGAALLFQGQGLAQKKVEPIVALVHTSNKEKHLSHSELKNIYLGKKRTWSNGSAVRPYMRPPRSEAGFAFFRTVLKMTPSRFRYHWQSLQLSGQGTIPRTVGSSIDVARVVMVSPGAVAIVTKTEAQRLARAVGSQVRIVSVVK